MTYVQHDLNCMPEKFMSRRKKHKRIYTKMFTVLFWEAGLWLFSYFLFSFLYLLHV